MEEKVRCERNSSLLIVEDDESQLRTLTAIMQEEGFDVIGCSTASEALEHLNRLETGVVVLDLRLPDLSGTQLLERLADATDKISVIINTAYSSYESAKDALNLGAFAYVEKAGDPEELLRHVHRAFQASLRSYADELETAVAERTHELLQANESLKEEINERELTEEALRASEEKYRALFENAGEGIITLDMDGRITGANRLVEEYGFNRDELVERRLFDFVPEYDKARSVSDFQALVAGRRVQGQMDIITPKGIITVEYRDTPIVRAGEVIGVQIILTDITEHKKAEEALSESEEKYRTLVQQSPLGIAIAQRHPFRLVFANPAMAGITDYSIDELISLSRRDFGALIHPEGRATFFKRFKDRWEGKPLTPTWEFRIVRKDGKLRWLEFSCKRIKYEGRLALQATFADITKHKRAEEALRKSEEHYRMLAETMNDGLGQMDENGRYVYVNNKFGEMFGYSPDEIVGRSWTDFFDEDAQKIINEQLTERRKGISKPYELKNTRKDGQKIFLRMSPQPIFDADNRYMGSISILTDITERKKAEEQIAKLAKFPAEDPNPVLRISGRGTVVYANKAGAILLKAWSCSVGQSLPNPWHELVLDALSSGQSQRTEAQCDDRIFSLIFAPVVDANYVNVYGHDITERKKTENELIENQAKLKAMASKILMTEEHERQRLAVGLHDEVCQKLVLTKLALESSLQLVSDSKVLASLRIACGGIGETIEQADSLTFELSNPVLHQLGFVIALEKYLTEEIRQKHGIEYELESDEQLGTMQDEIKNCLFRVTRELLTNVVKHAHARKVKVSARESQSQIYVRVQDDGVGFKYSEVGAEISQTARFGLFSIREQLEYLGGHLEIESEPGRGTTATVVVPQTKKTIV